MPEHLRALVVILLFASMVFVLAKPHVCALAIPPQDFARRRNLWVLITLTAFLAHNFWLFVLIATILLLMASAQERNKLALFLFLLLAIPSFGAPISGLGIIKQFFTLNYVRLLSLTILLPAFLALRTRAAAEREKLLLPDKLLLAYLVLQLLLQVVVDTFTNTLRQSFYLFIDVVLPYYVASRSLRSLKDFREALAGFAVGAMVMSLVGLFEFARHWLLYSSLDEALGLSWDMGAYLGRGESIRALGTSGQPIALGYVLAVASTLYLLLRPSMSRKWGWWLGLLLLIGGLVSPMSRGPWVGALIGLLLFICMGPTPGKNLFKLGLAGLILLPPLLMSPYGEQIIERLPFIGTLESENLAFRQRLLEISLEIIWNNPFFGSYDFMTYLEELRQGNGLIDIVNTYLAIALYSGLVGLSFFVSFFGVILLGTFRAMRKVCDPDDERHLFGRVLLSTMVSVLVMIFSVSSITVIPVIYWVLAGICFAYFRLFSDHPKDIRVV